MSARLRPNSPNYTQIPNCILDSIAEFTECELAVVLVVCRLTFGWHRVKTQISMTALIQITGRSKNGIKAGIASLIERGFLLKTDDPDGNEYQVLLGDQPLTPPGSTIDPGGDQPLTPPYKERNDLKKEDVPVATATGGNLHAEFFERWKTEYPKAHNGEAYVFQGAKDGSAVKRLITSGLTLDHLFRIANNAWARSDLFNCKQAASIAGFAARINDIRAELNQATGKGNPEGSNRRENLSSKPLTPRKP